jgi:hypothetical protein
MITKNENQLNKPRVELRKRPVDAPRYQDLKTTDAQIREISA